MPWSGTLEWEEHFPCIPTGSPTATSQASLYVGAEYCSTVALSPPLKRNTLMLCGPALYHGNIEDPFRAHDLSYIGFDIPYFFTWSLHFLQRQVVKLAEHFQLILPDSILLVGFGGTSTLSLKGQVMSTAFQFAHEVAEAKPTDP